MTGAKTSRRLPRLWDERITTAQGRKVRRYSVHRNALWLGCRDQWAIWDELKRREFPHPDGKSWQVCAFRTRDAAENYLKRTTVRSYELARLNAKLDGLSA
jgi:hypothetical protein